MLWAVGMGRQAAVVRVPAAGETMAPYPDFPIPEDEEGRLRALERGLLLDTDSDPNLDRIVQLATEIFHTPIALISLVDQERQWFLSRIGLEASETPRQMAFCAHAISANGVLVVPDAREDNRFNSNPLVTGELGIRFYAGAPLLDADGQKLGTLCVIDHVPHLIDPQQQRMLQLLSEQVVRELELRRQSSHCPITGCFDRPSFLQLGQKEFQRARRSRSSLSLITLLIEPPPPMGPPLAHQDINPLLARVADLCRRHSHRADLLGRLGNWELALLLVNGDETRRSDQLADGALATAEAILQENRQLEDDESGERQLPSLRIGLSRLEDDDGGFSDLLIRSDNALCLARPDAVVTL